MGCGLVPWWSPKAVAANYATFIKGLHLWLECFCWNSYISFGDAKTGWKSTKQTEIGRCFFRGLPNCHGNQHPLRQEKTWCKNGDFWTGNWRMKLPRCSMVEKMACGVWKMPEWGGFRRHVVGAVAGVAGRWSLLKRVCVLVTWKLIRIYSVGITGWHTPTKINMEPENTPLEEENHLPNSKPSLSGSKRQSWGVYLFH